MSAPARFYLGEARATLQAHLTYRWTHLISNLASAAFGLVFIAVWQAVTRAGPAGGWSQRDLTLFIATNQCLLWVSTFGGLVAEVTLRVREGTLALDLARPQSYYWYLVAHELGAKAYNILFRSAAMALVFALTVGFTVPRAPGHALLAGAAVILAAYVGATMTILVALASFWMVDVRWLAFIQSGLMFTLGGSSMPIEFLPGWLSAVARHSPFPCMVYYPSLIWLGRLGAEGLIPMAGWALLLTVMGLWMAGRGRNRLEVVGG